MYQMVKQKLIISNFLQDNRSLNSLLFVLHDISKLYYLLGEAMIYQQFISHAICKFLL
jgi:hypothetical protein